MNPIWLQSWCKRRSHRRVFMPRCVRTGSDTLSVFSVFVICGAYATSDIPSLEAPRGVGGRDHHRGRMWAPLCCLECGFLRREGAVKDRGEGKYLSWSPFHPRFLPDFFYLHTAYSYATCSLSLALTTPSLFTHIHHHNLADLAQELRLVWRKCLHPLKSPRASFVIPSDTFWPGLSWGPGAAEEFHFHQFDLKLHHLLLPSLTQ